jgi:hypothetical protein
MKPVLSETELFVYLIFFSVYLLHLLNDVPKIVIVTVPMRYFKLYHIQNAVFWDVEPCRYFVNQRFGGKYRLHLQGIRNLRAMNQREQVAVD